MFETHALPIFHHYYCHYDDNDAAAEREKSKELVIKCKIL